MKGKFVDTAAVASGLAALAALAGLGGCTAPKSSNMSSQSSGASVGAVVAKIAVKVSDGQGNVVYSDDVAGSRLQLTAGQSYTLNLAVSSPAAGATYVLVANPTSVVSGTKLTFPLVAGPNPITFPAGSPGNYAWKIEAVAPGASEVDKSYIAAVQCASPTFTQGSLNPAGIQVSAGSGTNLYSFAAAGVVSGANGMAPYQCAWDPTGTGIQDTAFVPCATAVSLYSNYVGSRNVGLLVQDACFTTFSVTQPENLAFSTPAMPGNIFIEGALTNPTGTAVGDARLSGVTYLATNSGGNNIVQPSYQTGTFKIESAMSYNRPSSIKFGMQIIVTGITDSISVPNQTGSISAANAQIASVTFSTDQAGDAAPAASLTGASCTLSNQGATVQFVAGQPCSTGTTGDNNRATVEVYGHYVCNSISSPGATSRIEGDFDGYTNMVDNCSGGGGGGGGGVAPIKL